MAQIVPLKVREEKIMRNLHKVEQITRLVIGGIMCTLGLTLGEPFLFIPGGIMAVTGLFGFCPVYRAFKFDTL